MRNILRRLTPDPFVCGFLTVLAVLYVIALILPR